MAVVLKAVLQSFWWQINLGVVFKKFLQVFMEIFVVAFLGGAEIRDEKRKKKKGLFEIVL